VCQTPPGGPDRVFHASRPSRGVVSCVALGLPGHPPTGVVPRYPPRGVLRDCSRPVPGSCRGVVSPLSGGFPHSGVGERKNEKCKGRVNSINQIVQEHAGGAVSCVRKRTRRPLAPRHGQIPSESMHNIGVFLGSRTANKQMPYP